MARQRVSPTRESTISTKLEDEARQGGYRIIAGVDEVGRGCLAGPVVAAAVILDPDRPFPEGLDDSKKLTANQRERIGAQIRETALAFAVAQVEADEIDQINIYQASCYAMVLALQQLEPKPDFVLADAVTLKSYFIAQRAIIHGDAISASIAAASVIAKTYRDGLMRSIHQLYPQYGFDTHVGYSTRKHLDALKAHGPTPLHRRSFAPVRLDEQSELAFEEPPSECEGVG